MPKEFVAIKPQISEGQIQLDSPAKVGTQPLLSLRVYVKPMGLVTDSDSI
jgi:hypothetical protein